MLLSNIKIKGNCGGEKTREPIPMCGGERPRSPYLCICWAKGPVRGRTPPQPGKAEDKGNGLPLRMTLRTIPWKRISIKKEQDKGRHKNI